MKRACENCRYFHTIQDPRLSRLRPKPAVTPGQCRRRAPVAAAAALSLNIGIWPDVWSDQWCGQWEHSESDKA